MTNLKLPFGLRGDLLIHISEAERGLACGCVCPSCHEPLVAKKGAVTAHHFSHDKGAECAKAVETALHLAAKQILEERREIALPAVQVNFDCYRPSFPIADERVFALDEIRVEHRTGDVVPDVLAYSAGHALMIEVHVTHAVDAEKLAKIRRLGTSTVEIDLSAACRTFSKEELTEAVVVQTANKKWLFNAKAEKLKQRFLRTGERKRSVHRRMANHVDHCPINARMWNGKPYANVTDDCLYCDFILEVGRNMNGIVCGGRHKVRTLQELRAFEEGRAT